MKCARYESFYENVEVICVAFMMKYRTIFFPIVTII